MVSYERLAGNGLPIRPVNVLLLTYPISWLNNSLGTREKIDPASGGFERTETLLRNDFPIERNSGDAIQVNSRVAIELAHQ